MILISVKSDVVDDKRQFTTDAKAMKFLKSINKLHDAHRVAIIGKKPLRKHYKVRYGRKLHFNKMLFDKAIEQYRLNMNQTLKLKVEIINTKYNQKSLSL